MALLIKIVLLLGTFLLMEAVAWFTHKYIMHGFLWKWHRSHHLPHHHIFEKNDLFALFFSIPAILFIIIGYESEQLSLLKWIGFGITLYGIFYFIFHDIIVHRRIKISHKLHSDYLNRIVRAHKVHHKHLSKEGAEAFGFLYASKKYSKK